MSPGVVFGRDILRDGVILSHSARVTRLLFWALVQSLEIIGFLKAIIHVLFS